MKGMIRKREAAEMIGVTEGTLSNWISEQRGPRYTKYLGKVWFNPKDIEAFKRSITEVRSC